MTRVGFFLFLLLVSIQAFCQRKLNDYVVHDSEYVEGIVTVTSARTIILSRGRSLEPIIFDFDQVESFRQNGRVFERVIVDGKAEFWTELVAGPVGLFKRGKNFLLQKDHRYISVDKYNFRQIFFEELPCDGRTRSLTKLTYNSTALRNFVVASNLGKCDRDHIPHIGYTATVAISSLRFGAKLVDSSPQADAVGYLTGVEVSMPVHPAAWLYLSTGLLGLWSEAGLYSEDRTERTTTYVRVQWSSFMVPVGMKCYFVRRKFGGFVEGGVWAAYSQLENKDHIETYQLTSGPFILDYDMWSTSRKFTFGYRVDVGVEYELSGRKAVQLKAGFLEGVNSSFDQMDIHFSGPALSVGFTF